MLVLAHCREFFGRKYVVIRTHNGKLLSSTIGDIDEAMAEIKAYCDSQGVSDGCLDLKEVEQLRVLDRRKTKTGRDFPTLYAERPFVIQSMMRGKFWATIQGATYKTRYAARITKEKRHANNMARVTSVL